MQEVLNSDRDLPARLHSHRIKWNFILNFMGVFLGKSKRIVIYGRWSGDQMYSKPWGVFIALLG